MKWTFGQITYASMNPMEIADVFFCNVSFSRIYRHAEGLLGNVHILEREKMNATTLFYMVLK